MSEFKGTKGIWTHNEQIVNNGSFYRVKGDTVKVCNVVTRNQEEAEANAKLIACAPEMLDALKECEEFLNRVQAPVTASLFLKASLSKLIKKATL